jgi:hypothetical protein
MGDELAQAQLRTAEIETPREQRRRVRLALPWRVARGAPTTSGSEATDSQAGPIISGTGGNSVLSPLSSVTLAPRLTRPVRPSMPRRSNRNSNPESSAASSCDGRRFGPQSVETGAALHAAVEQHLNPRDFTRSANCPTRDGSGPLAMTALPPLGRSIEPRTALRRSTEFMCPSCGRCPLASISCGVIVPCAGFVIITILRWPRRARPSKE